VFSGVAGGLCSTTPASSRTSVCGPRCGEAFGLPWLVIRALSHLAGGNALVDFTTFVDQAAASSATILRRLLPVL
jgi:hypothetical protein